MNFEAVEKIANAVLYEGYLLYPYRSSAVKNRQRWNFGVVYPEAHSVAQRGIDPWTMQTECLILGSIDGSISPTISVKVRFLHLISQEVGELLKPVPKLLKDIEPEYRIVDSLKIGDRVIHPWQDSVERDVTVNDVCMDDLVSSPLRLDFDFPPPREIEFESLGSSDGEVSGLIVRRQSPIKGAVELQISECGMRIPESADPKSESRKPKWERLFKATVRILNLTQFGTTQDRSSKAVSEVSREEVLLHSFISTHTLLGVRNGEFISLLDPPDEFRKIAATCSNEGTWPVMVGEEGERHMMLSSPIILYDYPEIAPESTGDLFDGTEIDELLTLRIMTLTDEEKKEVRETDQRAREILERIETLPMDHLMKLHGAVRSLHPLREERKELADDRDFPVINNSSLTEIDGLESLDGKARLDRVRIGGIDLRPGDRVRLLPKQKGTDIFDIALEGKTATIESIEQDFEDRIYLAVTVDSDPGRELGAHRMPAHRFFFSPEEVEPLAGRKERNA